MQSPAALPALNWRCIFGHAWTFHPLVRDWFCQRCRCRRRHVGVRV
jgi:hypothetical protein